MHFIGNRAIILGDGEADIQLVYDPGYSVLSVILPVIGLSIAFAVAELRFRSHLLHNIALIATGAFAGLSIVGMHYMGNFGIKNYTLNYRPRFFWASIVIAIGDCLLVLHIFYTWRDKWINDARKRFLCALALAGGVSAMHFTASTNCVYKLTSWSTRAARQSRNVQVIVAGTLCGGAVLIAFGVLVFFHLRTERRQRASKKVMISCAIFDQDDRIMVTTEGILPSREISDKFNSYTFAEDFDKAHPVYHWIFRITRNWSIISGLIPRMRSHLSALGADGDIWSSIPTTASSIELETCTDYSIVLRERFCVAAASLASSMHLPVERIGALYDDIVDTGTLITEENTKRYSGLRIPKTHDDLETGGHADSLGKGQLLFLTRRVNADDVDRLANAGFKFASVQQIGRNIAQNMQISFASLQSHIAGLRRYNDNVVEFQKHGTFLGCFAMLPRPHSKGFEVVVDKNDQGQLPDVQLLPEEPTIWQADFLEGMHGKTALQCITYLKNRSAVDSSGSENDNGFAAICIAAIMSLCGQLPAAFFQVARFYGTPVYPHYAHPLRHPAPVTTLYAFVVCADLHTPINTLSGLVSTPLSFLRVRHQCYSGSPHYADLEREIHKEFGPLLARRTTKSSDGIRRFTRFTTSTNDDVISTRPTSYVVGDDKSDLSFYASPETALAKVPSRRIRKTSSVTANMSNEPFGGILVNNETVVETDQKSDDYVNPAFNFGMGSRAEVGTGIIEPEKTFIDELYAFACTTIPQKCGL